MICTKTARVLVGAANILIAASPLVSSHISHASTMETKTTTLNLASLKSIESTWLKVPSACKARGFNADAAPVADSSVSQNILNLYSRFII